MKELKEFFTKNCFMLLFFAAFNLIAFGILSYLAQPVYITIGDVSLSGLAEDYNYKFEQLSYADHSVARFSNEIFQVYFEYGESPVYLTVFDVANLENEAYGRDFPAPPPRLQVDFANKNIAPLISALEEYSR